ncbi:MAG: regulatory protein RecX [Proteobacteria bacterium]|nr:regulatory protein RecX [Pseudomonadota bacterium]MDA1291138.1 regulatory protein RecX [Pseudomonadota bacterium]
MPSLSMSAVSSGNEGLFDGSGKLDRSDKLESASRCKKKKVSETTPCNDVPVLRRAAMDYLARREHSLFELMQKLSKKFPETDKELLLEVLETLKSEKLQSDERFTEAYVRYRKSRGFAYLHIKADLAGRRVSDRLITKHLLVDDEDWQRTAQQLVVKKLRHQESPSYGSKLHRKLTRFLESRGFASTEIRKALEKHLV